MPASTPRSRAPLACDVELVKLVNIPPVVVTLEKFDNGKFACASIQKTDKSALSEAGVSIHSLSSSAADENEDEENEASIDSTKFPRAVGIDETGKLDDSNSSNVADDSEAQESGTDTSVVESTVRLIIDVAVVSLLLSCEPSCR